VDGGRWRRSGGGGEGVGELRWGGGVGDWCG
jgi:hypothetical protein